MKKLLRNIVDSVPEPSMESITERIRDYRVVSFDVFDTLIKRNCAEPSDIFLLTAERYNRLNDCDVINAEQFRADRIDAARKVRQKNEREITLNDIYLNLEEKYKERTDTLKQCEVDTELSRCYANPAVKSVLKKCVSEGKEIYLITDMYLSKDIISSILVKSGYHDYKELIVSNEVGVRKRNGELFKYFIDEYDIDPKECIHIGDNVTSDVLGANKAGIKSIHIPLHTSRTIYMRKGDLNKDVYEKYRNIISNHIDPEWNEYFHFGYECLGPFLTSFVNWVRKETEDTKSKVFFMSRDGYLLNLVYNELLGESENKSEYLYISRRSVHFPLFHLIKDFQEYFSLNGNNKRWSVLTACSRLNIDIDRGKEEWRKLGFSLDYSFKANEINTNEKLLSFFNHFKEEAVKKSKEEYKYLCQYFKGLDFSGDVIVVDSGGNGTSQNCLELLSRYGAFDANIVGYYMWSTRKNSERFKTFRNNDVMVGGETIVSELPLTPEEGTTIRYSIDDSNNSTVILDEFEFKDKKDICKTICDIQEGVISYARDFKDTEFVAMDPELAYHNAMMATRHPRLFETNIFGDLYFHSDNEDTYLAKPKSLVYYMIHPKNLIQEFKLIRWKVGFLKRLFRIPFPYYNMLRLLKGINK